MELNNREKEMLAVIYKNYGHRLFDDEKSDIEEKIGDLDLDEIFENMKNKE
jgi:hypothetical protein